MSSLRKQEFEGSRPLSGLRYRDYAAFPQGERWELIRGVAYAMSPAPSWKHQEIALLIGRELSAFLKGKPCKPFVAPVDVFLPEAGQTKEEAAEVETVVQPDLGVVCDPEKIFSRGVFGSPDLVMEILSPSSVLHDLNRKKEVYARHGCREYWIWEGSASWVIVHHRLEGGGWDEGVTFGPEDTARSLAIEGFSFSIAELRAELS